MKANGQIELNMGQGIAFNRIKDFVSNKDASVFILKGYAGTGKTTLIRYLVDYFRKTHISFQLLASTGRAAKVLSNITGEDATTVHKCIYKYQGFNTDFDKILGPDNKPLDVDAFLYLSFGLSQRTALPIEVYIIDEASMISDVSAEIFTQAKFGTGKLLSDLLSYDKKGHYIFVGDPCQLPPVNQKESPALSIEYFRRNFNIKAEEYSLTEIMRQEDDNDIIETSALVREFCAAAPDDASAYAGNKWCCWRTLPFRGRNNIVLLDSPESMVNQYVEKIRGGKYENAAFICRSNRQCTEYGLRFRAALGYSGVLKPGELLLVTQNNLLTSLRNGDLVRVIMVSPSSEQRAGLTFRTVEVEELITKNRHKLFMIEDLLLQQSTNLGAVQQKALFIDFAVRMRKMGVKQHTPEFDDQMMNDPYLNALRGVFGYSLTCHKAQGGEWPEVYVMFTRNIMANPLKEAYKWTYTAMTRARKRMYLIDDIYVDGYHR